MWHDVAIEVKFAAQRAWSKVSVSLRLRRDQRSDGGHTFSSGEEIDHLKIFSKRRNVNNH